MKIKSEVVSAKDASGEDIKIIYYIAEITGDITLDNAEKFLRSSENYIYIWENNELSKEIKRINDNEWIIYLFFDSPWPMPDNDLVHRMRVEKDGEKGLRVQATAEPDAYKRTDAGRMTLYDALFDFEYIGNGKTKLILTVTFSPVGNAPKWMINTWFPEGPAGIVKRLIEKASE